jgi:hypothetical protein
MPYMDLVVTHPDPDPSGRTAHAVVTSDRPRVSIDWRDGSDVEEMVSVDDEHFELDHEYANEGIYRIEATAQNLRDHAVFMTRTAPTGRGSPLDVATRLAERRVQLNAAVGVAKVGRSGATRTRPRIRG